MARIRTIKPEFFFDEDIAGLKPLARLLYIGLWCLADREGLLEDKPRQIKAHLFPYADVEIDKLLGELQSPKPFIMRYLADNKPYIWVVHFLKHQRPHHTEAKSVFPCFNGELTVRAPLFNGDMKTVKNSLVEGREGKGKEGKGKEGNGQEGDKRPTRPTIQEVEAYCKERGNSVNPSKWFNHYESNGWRVGKNPMKDWRAAVRTWEQSDIGTGQAPQSPHLTSAGALKINPADVYLAEQARIERENAFHDKHTAGGKCAFCGDAVENMGVCSCGVYRAELEKVKNEK